MAKNNGEALKKHHFWILAGLAPLLVLIAVVLMMGGVGSAIAAKQKEIEGSVKDVQSQSAPGVGTIAELDKQKEELQKKKGELWKENWERQKTYYTWPASRDRVFDKYADLKFGDRIRETSSEFEEFTKNYHEMFKDMAARVKPTKFNGEWTSVLRYVFPWGQQTPRSEQIWLALEDVWIQRALLEPIHTVNQETASFALLPETKDTPLKRKFRSRVWDLTIEVADQEQGRVKTLKGKLKNRTPQLQLLGHNNTMKLLVWLDTQPGSPPVPFDVQGEFVAGDAEIEVPYLPSHTLLPGTVPTEIAKVEQVLDDRTVPVRRIDQLRIGYKSARDYSKELKYPEFWKEDATATAPPGASATGGAAVGGGTLGSPDGMGTGRGGLPGMSGTGFPGGAGVGAGTGQSGPPAVVLDANRKRYLEWTDQVRRIPVALVVVVDQMFIPDVLIAYANSDFRFYTVQTHWKRFHGSLASQTTGPGVNIPGGTGSPDSDGPSVGGIVGDQLRGGFSGPGGGFPGAPGAPGAPGFPGFGGFGGAATSNISEAQANAGLVELTIYGVISLYQKADEKKDTPADAPKADAPKEEPKADAPKTGETKPADPTKPAAGDPKAPETGKSAAGDPKAPETGKPAAGDPKAPAPTTPPATLPTTTPPTTPPPTTPPPANPPAPGTPGNPKM